MFRSSLPLVATLTLIACGPAKTVEETDAGTDAGPTDAGPREVPCVDQSIATLDLFTNVAPGLITEEGTTSGEFTTHIDATAGTPPGGTSPTKSFVYAKFGDNGLQKVAIDDESAFASSDWDIAFRRYVVRVNSGVSGPSEVQVGRTAPNTTFEGLTAAPTNLAYRTEAYFTETCDFVSDGSGLAGPGTALSSFWTYGACLKMTDNVYVIKLASGKHVKLQVLRYYDTVAAQEQCETSNTLPSPSGSANLHVRWAFLP